MPEQLSSQPLASTASIAKNTCLHIAVDTACLSQAQMYEMGYMRKDYALFVRTVYLYGFVRTNPL
jgi:hypothetical protein